MHSPTIALTWEYWRRSWRQLFLILAGFYGFIFLLYLIHGTEGVPDPKVLSPVMAYMYFVLVAFLPMKQLELRDSNRICFPSRWFLLPVSTARLVGLQMGFTVLTAALLYLLSVGILRGVLFIPAPPVSALPVMIMAAVSIQAILWSLFAFPLVQVFLCIGLVLGHFLWWHIIQGDAAKLPGPLRSFGPVPVGVYLTVAAATIAVAYGVSVWGVSVDRRGGSRKGMSVVWELMANWIVRRTSCAASSAFSSPFRAHLWLEWRLRGIWLPGIAAAFLIVVTVCAKGFGVQQGIYEAISLVLIVCVVITSWSIGLVVGHAEMVKTSKGFFSSFYATRPLSTSSLSLVILAALALSTALTFVILLVGTFSWGGPGRMGWFAAEVLAQARILSAPPDSSLRVFFVILFSLLAALWIFQAFGLAMSLAGRNWIAGALIGLVYVSLLPPAVMALLRDDLETVRTILLALGWGWTIVLVAGILIAQAAAVRLGLMPARHHLLAWILWAALFGISLLLFPGVLNPSLTVLAIILVPVCATAPLSCVPLAFHWNRHR